MIYRCLWGSLLHLRQIGLGGNDDDGVMTKGGENHATQHVDYIDEVYIKCYFQTHELLYCFPFFC
jgi:hypothetical protein